jgi:hypothetical protein
VRTSAFTFLGILLFSNTTLGRTWHINPDGTGDAPTIQAGVDSAATGDVVQLADGTFTGPLNRDIDCQGKAITVRSQSGTPASCIIDCQASPSEHHRGFVFASGEPPACVLEGVTITAGYVSDDVPSFDGSGGGILVVGGSSPTITNVVISGNTAMIGGGLFIHESSSPTITDCTFADNTAWWGSGGGIGCYEFDSTVSGCTFHGNAAHQVGGGMSCTYSSPMLINCFFYENSLSEGGYGAGFECSYSSAELVNCVFAGNSVSGSGGGMCVWLGSAATVTGCTFTENSAGGLYCVMSSSMTLENTILAFSAGGAAILCDNPGAVTFTCCDVFGNEGGDWVGCIADQAGLNGNFSADPLFCDPENGDFTIRSDSPCAPPGATGCGLVGALPVGCGPIALEEMSWGEIKNRYR